MNETIQSTPDPSMSVRDAIQALVILAGWTPPEGVTATAAASCHPGLPDRRVVNVVLSAGECQLCVIRVGEVPGPGAIDAIAKAADTLLQAAWDEPACIGLGPDADDAPADLFAPTGPLNLGATPHPICDTSKMGRDE